MGIKLENVTKIYTTGEVETVALKQVNLEIKDGEVIVLQTFSSVDLPLPLSNILY